MAAKRELSSTLRNLKFMQRATVARKAAEEKPEVEVEVEVQVEAEAAVEVVAASGVVRPPVHVARKCIVVMEGNPHPGAVKGRMSFQNFNPSIDKLNEEATSGCQNQTASPSNYQDNGNSSRTGEVLKRFKDSNVDSSESISLNELKRKQPEFEMETPPSHKPQKTTPRNVDGDSSSQSNGQGSHKSNKREKLDWNLLRPRKSK